MWPNKLQWLYYKYKYEFVFLSKLYGMAANFYGVSNFNWMS